MLRSSNKSFHPLILAVLILIFKIVVTRRFYEIVFCAVILKFSTKTVKNIKNAKIYSVESYNRVKLP